MVGLCVVAPSDCCLSNGQAQSPPRTVCESRRLRTFLQAWSRCLPRIRGRALGPEDHNTVQEV